MHGSLRSVILLGALVAAASPGIARAGDTVDPNLGDTVLGRVGGIRYAVESAPYDPTNDGFAEVAAGCGGPSWQIVGGGAAARGAAPSAWLVMTRPLDHLDADLAPDDAWATAGLGPTGKAITAFSICLRGAKLRHRTKDIPDQPSVKRSGSVGCGARRWHATAGGTFIATVDSWVGSSYPIDTGDVGTLPDDGWRGTAYDTAAGRGGAQVSVVCAAGLRLRYVWGVSRSLRAGRAASWKVACGASEHVVGGGVKVGGSVDRARLMRSAPYDGSDADAIPDDGWAARVYNVSGSAKRVKTFAICLS